MGKSSKPKSSSSKEDKKEEGLYVKFEVPLNYADSTNNDKYERKVKSYSDGKAFDWCEFRENTEDLFDAFGCQGLATNNANKRHHLYIALFVGRAKEVYMANYNRINLANNQIEIDEQLSDAEVLQVVIKNETAKLLIGKEQLITIVHHALHGIMQLQIQRAGQTIN
jgi:hypothetical protein